VRNVDGKSRVITTMSGVQTECVEVAASFDSNEGGWRLRIAIARQQLPMNLASRFQTIRRLQDYRDANCKRFDQKKLIYEVHLKTSEKV